MKSLLLALALFTPTLSFAMEPTWLSETLVTAPVSQSLQGRGQLLPLDRYFNFPRNSQVTSLIVTAATAGGRGRMEVLVDGRQVAEVVVERQLRAYNLTVNNAVTSPSSLTLRTEGNFYIASIAVALARDGSQPLPSPLPPGPTPLPPPADSKRACESFAFDVYKAEGYNNSGSLTMAAQYCASNHTLFRDERLFRRIFDLFKGEGYNNSGALTLTAQYVKNNWETIQNRFESFEWLVGLFRSDGYNNSGALTLTAQQLARVPEGIMSCAREKHPIYKADGYNNSGALTLAIQFCSR